MSNEQEKKAADDSVPQVTVEHETAADSSAAALAAPATEAEPEAPIEATAEQPVLSERDLSAMADPHNASSPMATDGPGVREENATPEHGSGAPIPWPFSN